MFINNERHTQAFLFFSLSTLISSVIIIFHLGLFFQICLHIHQKIVLDHHIVRRMGKRKIRRRHHHRQLSMIRRHRMMQIRNQKKKMTRNYK